MHPTIWFAVATLLVILSPANASAGSCKRPTPAESFSASFRAALILSTDPDTANLTISGGEGSLKLYMILKNDLGKLLGPCDAEQAAFTAAKALATVEELALLDYFAHKANVVGTVLHSNGVLDCDNSVPTSLSLLGHVREALKDLDPKKFESHFKALADAVVQLYQDLGLNLPDVAQQTSDVFSDEFSESDKCKQKTAKN